MRRDRFLAIGLVAVAAALVATSARAAETPPRAPAVPNGQALGSEGAWSAYLSEDKTGRVCYLVGHPENSLPATARRMAATATVTHRPADKIANVVSLAEGYPLKQGSEVSLTLGTRRFELFASDDNAWARTSQLDREIVETFAKSRDAVVTGIPARGPATTDTYSLAGFAKELGLIDQACGVRR
jgi:hypothetical protein